MKTNNRKTVGVIATGVANMASVIAAFERLDCNVETLTDVASIYEFERVVLPGVGAFSAGITALRSLDLIDVIRKRVNDGRPTLSICLGLQLLAASSEEAVGVVGIGVYDVPVKRMKSTPSTVIPQMGWNDVAGQSDFVATGYGYFANSYALQTVPEGWTATTYEHGDTYIASLERGAILSCQFHPELSGAWGSNILKRWLAC